MIGAAVGAGAGAIAGNIWSKKMEAQKQSIEKNATANQNAIIQRLDLQDKEIKSLKTILLVICGLIVIGTIATIFVLK